MSSGVQELRLPREKSSETRESAVAAPFISGHIADNFWIILAPVVALLVMELFWRFSGLSDVAIFSVLFALIVTGHQSKEVTRVTRLPRALSARAPAA